MTTQARLGRGQSNELVTLVRGGVNASPRWDEQFADYTQDSLEAQFGLNCLATAGVNRPSSLVPREVLDTIADWAAYSVVSVGDDVLTLGDPPAPAVQTVRLLEDFGLPDALVPQCYRGPRFSNAIYFVRQGAVYELLSDVAVRVRLWSDIERAAFESRSVFPFLELAGVERYVIVVCLPGRTASAAGTRGFRTALHESGRLAQLLQAGLDDWMWTTEFDDFAVCDLLDLDGLQRFPVSIGIQMSGGRDVG